MTTPSKHGGKRPGAGRPKKVRNQVEATFKTGTAAPVFDTAEDYLSAVVRGLIEPDPARIQAAKTLISYQQVKQRTPKKSPTPAELAKREEQAIESAVADEFEKKAAEIRRRHAKRRRKSDGDS